MDILKGLHKSGRTVIIITHDDDIAREVDRVVRIIDGKVEADYRQNTGKPSPAVYRKVPVPFSMESVSDKESS